MQELKRTALMAGLLGVGVALAGLALALDIPKEKHEITLAYIAGDKGDVKFPHKKHATEAKVDGKPIACATCHHTLKAAPKTAKDVQKCGDCHVAEGTKQKQHEGKAARYLATKDGDKYNKKSVIFHGLCEDCHKKVGKVGDKSIKGCKTCHTG